MYHQQVRFQSLFFLDDLDDFFFGTLAPDFLASESPIAIACLRLFNFLPDFAIIDAPFIIQIGHLQLVKTKNEEDFYMLAANLA